MQKLDVSIIIVNYNTIELTRSCLKSVFEKTEGIEFEVIVSDNGSTDGSVEMICTEFPQVILIENNENLGFGAANNRGLKIAKGKYIFYLNSDTVLLNNAVKIFFDYWENSPEREKIGALGCMLQNENGDYIHSFGEFPTVSHMAYTLFRFFMSSLFGNLRRKLVKRKYKSYITSFAGDKKIDGYVTGADLFVKNDRQQLFDERFFMYFEETDLQYNYTKKRGFDTYILKDPAIIHLEGASDTSFEEKGLPYNFGKKSSIYYWLSCLKYFRKNASNSFLSFLLKVQILAVWLFPPNIRSTAPFIKELMKI